MYFTYLLLAFAVITAVNCIFYLLFLKFAFSKHHKSDAVSDPASLIVYIKNQEAVLDDFLQKLHAQTSVNHELILVNNASFDSSLEILENFQKEHPNAHIVDVENNEAFWGSKKYALTLGIKKATNEKLLFITPEAEVFPENWIQNVQSILTDKKQLVVGYQNFEKKKGLLGKLMRYNRFQSFMQNLGFGSITKPYFASQDNLAYTSSLFYEVNGFSSHMSIHSGTENMFLKEASTFRNVGFATHRGSRILSKIPSFGNWIKDCKTHLQSYSLFPGGVKFSLTLYYLTQLLFWVGAIAGGIIFQNFYWFCLIGIRFLIAGLCIGQTAFKLGERDLFILFPFLEISNIITQLFIFIGNTFSKPSS